MFKLLTRIFSLILSFVVIYSTTSPTIYQHFCGEKLVESSIYIENDGCMMSKSDSINSCKKNKEKKNCCDDHELAFEGVDKLQLETYTFDISFEFFKPVVNQSIDLFRIEIKQITPSYLDYRPPPLIKRIYQLDQTYLI